MVARCMCIYLSIHPSGALMRRSVDRPVVPAPNCGPTRSFCSLRSRPAWKAIAIYEQFLINWAPGRPSAQKTGLVLWRIKTAALHVRACSQERVLILD